MAGLTIPVVITVYGDRTFSFITKTPPAPVSAAEGCGYRKGLGHSEQGEEGQSYGKADHGDCDAEDAGPELEHG